MTKPFCGDEICLAYERYRDSQWIRFSAMSALVAGILVPSFAVLDYFVYPEWFVPFAQLRIGCTISIVFLVLIALYDKKRHVKVFTMIGALLIQLMVNYMVVMTEGADSGYYAGLNLTVIAVGLILPALLHETVLFGFTTVSLYTVACYLNGNLGADNALIENLFFLVGTGIIASFSTYYLEARRRQEFLLSYELEQRNKELDELNRRRAEFFANVSHELRTPLTLILAPVQEVLNGATYLPDKLASRLGVVRDNGLRLLKLVNDLLDVIRLEEGKETLDRTPLDLSSMLSGIVDSMVYLADTKNIKLTTAFSSEKFVINADVRALEKVVVNLLGNALKFTQERGCVEVTTYREGSRVVVQVKDSGIGIPKEQQGRIFERFQQVDGSSTRRFRGTGLGLALVRDLVEKMEGEVAVESEQGQGSTFIVSFPLSADECVARKDAAEDDGLEALHRQAERSGGITVEEPETLLEEQGGTTSRRQDAASLPVLLVVEDEPDMRRYLVDLLSEEYRVLQARTGTEGLRLAQDRSPDLVLLDLMLPEMDGLEVCQRIRSDAISRWQKIMLLTARADEKSKITALQQGADDFLTKPFSSVEIKTRLRNLLSTAVLERNLDKQNKHLQTTLSELEATQGQLVQSEKLNALGSLAAGLLHEINNPLNYSLTAIQLVQSDSLVMENDLLHEIVTDIDEGMQRIRAIVSDLRAFAYPSEAAKLSPFKFREAVESALRFTANELKGIEIIVDLPEDARVLASKSHIVQVLLNLLTNAGKAISPLEEAVTGEIRIYGTCANGRLYVRVVDNGVGMDGETLNRIFDPFFTTRDVGEGMGLGLSICHTIVSNHGGRLLARSQVGEGTELAFDLPLAENAKSNED